MHPDTNTDALSVVAACLNRAGLRWMLVGSVAAFLYGHERSTHDVDVVFDPEGVDPKRVAEAFAPDYMLDPLMLEDTLRTGYMANALPLRGGPKIDLSPLGDEPFEQTAFSRREARVWHDEPIAIISAPDLVIAKLKWAKDSKSERQLADVRAIMATGRVDENNDEFKRWIDRLSLRDLLDASREAGYEA